MPSSQGTAPSDCASAPKGSSLSHTKYRVCSSQKRYGDPVQLALTRNRPDRQGRGEASANKVHYKSASCRGKCYPSLFIIDHHASISTGEGPESCQLLANLPPALRKAGQKKLTKYRRLCKVRITKYQIRESRFLSQSSGKGGRGSRNHWIRGAENKDTSQGLVRSERYQADGLDPAVTILTERRRLWSTT